ncbi:MAG: hypothetical protein ABR562_01210 [Thermoplasmatota archaeon]
MDFWTEYGPSLTTLGLYAVGIAAFTLAVTALYLPMGTRLMFAKRFGERAVATPGRRFLYVLLFPIVSFAFFLLVAATLIVFSNPDITGSTQFALTPEYILVISMAMVLAIRISAYFHEEGAQELAKVMPLGLLGFMLVTNRIDKLGEALGNMSQLLDHVPLIVVFFVVVVVVEFLLRAIYELAGRPGRKAAKPAAPQRPTPPPAVTRERRP